MLFDSFKEHLSTLHSHISARTMDLIFQPYNPEKWRAIELTSVGRWTRGSRCSFSIPAPALESSFSRSCSTRLQLGFQVVLAAHGSNPGNSSSNTGKLMPPPRYHHMWVCLPRTHNQTRGKYWIMIFSIRKKPFFISNFKLRQEGRGKLWLLLRLETPKKSSGLLRCPEDKRFTRFRQLHQRCF